MVVRMEGFGDLRSRPQHRPMHEGRLIAGQRIETSWCDAMESEMKAGDIRVVGSSNGA
jgi:hypothetical protein